MSNLNEDPEYRRFWAAFQDTVAYQDRGLWLPAREQLDKLRVHPRRTAFDPNRNIDYTYAICLLQMPLDKSDLRASLKILETMLTEVEGRRLEGNSTQLRVEIASALILLGRFREAEATVQGAIGLDQDHRLTVLGYQNLGRALFEQGRLSDAAAAYRTMLHIAVERHNIAHAGVAAEWMGRIALRENDAEAAAAWRDLASDAYRTDATRHLHSLDVFKEVAGLEMPPKSVYLLGAEAIAMRATVPIQNELGDRAGIHIDSLNIDIGALRFLGDLSEEETITWEQPILAPDRETANHLCRLIVAEAHAILPHSWDRRIIEELTRDLWPSKSEAILKRLSVPDPGGWSVQTADSRDGDVRLLWRSSGAGPSAFGTELTALAILTQVGVLSRMKSLEMLSDNGIDASSIEFLNLANRSFPRPLQMWILTRSEIAVSGAPGPLHLAEDSTRQRILSNSANQLALEAIEYSQGEIQQLQKGRLVALLATEVMVPGGGAPRQIGTTPINEINIANPPASFQPKPDVTRPGFVIDREYNTAFFAPSLKTADFAWYGQNNRLFRDHFSEFHKKIEISGSLRAKHYSIPIVDVHDREQLNQVTALISEATERLKPTKHVEPNDQVWYRGQVRGYALDRSELVSSYLFGQYPVSEPSLPGAAPRRGWNYLKVHSFLSTMLQARIYREAKERGESFSDTHAKWKQFAAQLMSWDLGVMLLAQHYGIPTHGIDITNDLEVAIWFATNKFEVKDGQATYKKVDEAQWGTEPNKWPYLYAILPVTHSLKGAIRDVDLFEPFQIDARRPKMQSAAFFMGAHGLHRNRLAEALVCVMRLAPGEWNTSCTYEGLFPAPEEDPSYAWMLDLKAKYKTGDIGTFLNEIPLYTR
jgi:tetratricopeptide (TPR) repeat protein